MISLPECKRILGSTVKNLSDEEVLGIRNALRDLAEVAIDKLVDCTRVSVNNYQLKSIEN